MYRQLRPLLPAVAPRQVTDSIHSRDRCRIACEQCRRSKSKCNGKRPVCSRCAKSGSACKYWASEGESIQEALKRRYDEAEAGNRRLRSILQKLQSASEQDAQDIFRRLRQPHSDPLALARLLEDGDLLLQPLYTSHGLDTCHPNPSLKGSVELNREKLARLDKVLLDQSWLKVKSAPWTRVASDGLVSHLLSLFLSCDNKGLLMFLDEDTFVTELTSGDVSTEKYCSRFLVNAICAFQSMFTANCAHYDKLLGESVQDRFFYEANRLSPSAMSPSYLAAEGYLLLYLCCLIKAKEHAGIIYRVLSADMIRRLSLDKSSQEPSDLSHKARIDHRRALSRAQWGLFNAHTIFVIGFRTPPEIHKPTIPRYFTMEEPGLGPDFDSGSNAMQLKNAQDRLCLDIICDVEEVLYDCTVYSTNMNFRLGSDDDLAVRIKLHQRLWSACNRIPNLFQMDYEHSFPTWCVRLFYMMALIPIWRDLLTMPTLKPFSDQRTVLDILVDECVATVEGSQRHEARCGIEYSVIAMSVCFTPPFILLNAIHENPRAPAAFTACCKILHERRSNGFNLTVLRALNIIAKQQNLRLPGESLRYFVGVEEAGTGFGDNQVDFVPPTYIPESTTASNDPSQIVRLGELVTRWAQMTIL